MDACLHSQHVQATVIARAIVVPLDVSRPRGGAEPCAQSCLRNCAHGKIASSVSRFANFNIFSSSRDPKHCSKLPRRFWNMRAVAWILESNHGPSLGRKWLGKEGVTGDKRPASKLPMLEGDRGGWPRPA
eukprot:6377771-Amphidinium_carterae.1